MTRRRPEELRSCRATRDPQLGLRLAAMSLLFLPGCPAAPAPGRNAVQDAFRADGLTAREARGHRIFRQRCATCHGPEGRGDGQNAYSLQPPPPDFQESLPKLSVGERRRIIEGGTASVGRSSLCPPWGRSLGPDDVDAVLAWLEAASRPKAVEPEPDAGPGTRRK